MGSESSMKIRNNYEPWRNDNESRETGKIISKELDLTGEIKITFHRPRQRQKNGSTMRKHLKLKHNTDFNNPKSRD
jgi:hypothetical protein